MEHKERSHRSYEWGMEMNHEPKILVVDDDPMNLMVLEATLKQLGYGVLTASTGKEGIEKAQQEKPSIILLDVMLPDISGFQVCEAVKAQRALANTPVVMVTALGDRESRLKGLEAGADEYLVKPIDRVELTLRLKNLLKVKAYNEYLEGMRNILEAEVAKRTQELQRAYEKLDEAYLEIIHRLGRAAEFRDDETGAHIQRMSHYCRILAREIGLPPEKQKEIFYASPMHDVGKIGIPDGILLKRGPLSPEEFEIMKKHTIIGAKILSGSEHPVLKMAETLALTHHERWDGSGYPHNLKGKEIPLEGRICSLADFFDACTSPRAYRPAIKIEEVLGIIKEAKGKHFDPLVVKAFFKALEEILATKEKYTDASEGERRTEKLPPR